MSILLFESANPAKTNDPKAKGGQNIVRMVTTETKIVDRQEDIQRQFLVAAQAEWHAKTAATDGSKALRNAATK